MFSGITNDEQDHWNPMSSNPTIPLCQDVPIEVDNPNDAIDEEQPIGGNNVFHAKNEVEEVSSATDNAKKGLLQSLTNLPTNLNQAQNLLFKNTSQRKSSITFTHQYAKTTSFYVRKQWCR